jgi:hypothetical protein
MPLIPIPIPLPLLTVATVFKDWQNWLQQKPPSYQQIIGFKLFSFSWEESVVAYGLFTDASQQGVITGQATIGVDEVTWEHDTGWHGNPFHTLPAAAQQATTASLTTVNGKPAISMQISPVNSPSPSHLRVELLSEDGTDPYLPSGVVLSGTRDNVPGRVMATFYKTSFEK